MRELCVVEEDSDSDAPSSRAPLLSLPPCGGNGSSAPSISNLVAERARSKTFFWSVELIPGTNALLKTQLEQSLEKLSNQKPAFASVTWHAAHLKTVSSRNEKTLEHPALDLSKRLQRAYGIPVLMHLAAGTMKQDQVQLVLQACLEAGVTNILALRGDDMSQEESDFKHASDLVHYIRSEYGSKFNIGVAGYPSVHTEAESEVEDLLHLKNKVNAGADFIFTQLITSLEEFHNFKQKCDELEIRVPIIPGIYLIQSFNAFDKFVKTCNIKVSQKYLKELQDLDKQNKLDPGIQLFQDLIKTLMRAPQCPGIHIFTINRVSRILEVLSDLGLRES